MPEDADDVEACRRIRFPEGRRPPRGRPKGAAERAGHARRVRRRRSRLRHATASLLGDSVEHIRRARRGGPLQGQGSLGPRNVAPGGPEGRPAPRRGRRAQAAAGQRPRRRTRCRWAATSWASSAARARPSVVFDMPEPPANVAEAAADLMLGMRMRAYRFDRYKTKKGDDAEPDGALTVRIAAGRSRPPRRSWPRAARPWPRASTSPATSSTSRRTSSTRKNSPSAPRRSTKLGVEVEILDVKAMQKLGMSALLGVGQGSRAREPRRHHALERREGPKAQARRLHRQGRHASTPAASPSSRPAAWRT